MTDRRLDQENRMKARFPFFVAGGVALFALMTHGFWPMTFVIVAFCVGYFPPEKILSFAPGVEEDRRIGREALHRLSEDQIIEINEIARAGRKIEAIKTLRAINDDGLREAKAAVDLLDDFGLKWNDSQDKPPR
ncbi:MAG: hypothetical protein AAFQ64_00605 [Pseudomonadota bacterium]